MGNNTQVIADKDKQELFVIREFDAPKDLVFKAFTDPEILVKFFAPAGNSMHFNHHNYSNLGSYSWCNKDEDGNVLCTFSGTVHEISPSDRIIQTAELMESPERGHVVLETMHFETLPDNRTKLIIHDVCRSVADRNAMVESGMEQGLKDIFNNLDLLLRNSKT